MPAKLFNYMDFPDCFIDKNCPHSFCCKSLFSSIDIANMKQILALLFILSLIACSNDVSKKNEGGSKQPVTNKGPAQTFQINKSIVISKLISKEVSDETEYSLLVKVLSVEENSSSESIAVEGDEYTCKPNFYYDENNKIPDNERNNALKELIELNPGDEFKAEITLNQSLGWMINKVLK